MLISQFRSILSITTGIIFLCVTSNFISAKPSPSRKLYQLPGKIAKCEQPHLKNGIVRLKRKMVKFDCSRGYTLLGTRHAECSGGKWDSPIPVCARKGCPKLETPQHGFFIEERNGLMVSLFCKDSYLTAGNIVAYCDGEMWDRELGGCRETTEKPQTWCDFETEDLCRWAHDDTDDFNWKRFTTFQANTVHTGPKFDHTYKEPLKGHYMLLESIDGIEDERARLISPLYEPEESVNACISLHYYMYGANVGSLNVYVKPISVDMDTILQNPRYTFFTKSGKQKNLWLNEIINIDQYSEPFQIIVEGSPGSGHLGDIAIDDVAIFQGTRCGKEEFRGDKDQVENTENQETIFDYQSCKGRCYASNATEGSDEVRAEGIIKKCDCHLECEDSKTCCPDYKSVCVFSISDPSDPDVIIDDSENKSLATTTTLPTTEEIRGPLSSGISAVSTIKPIPSVKAPLVLATQVLKQQLSTWTKSFSTIPSADAIFSTTPAYTITAKKLHGTQPTVVPNATVSEIELSKVEPNPNRSKSEVFSAETETSKLPGIMMQDDPSTSGIVDYHFFQESASEKETADPGPFPVVAVIFSLLTISIILLAITFGLKYYHRNYGPQNYKKNAEDANRRPDRGAEEFSDVLYLTEQIDFTMQTQQS